MQTAIFVYQATSVTISTNETDLQLCNMDNETVPLASGQNYRSVSPGIYKIVSNQIVDIDGDNSAFEKVETNSKTSTPTLPVKALQLFASTYLNAFNSFFATPDAKNLPRSP